MKNLGKVTSLLILASLALVSCGKNGDTANGVSSNSSAITTQTICGTVVAVPSTMTRTPRLDFTPVGTIVGNNTGNTFGSVIFHLIPTPNSDVNDPIWSIPLNTSIPTCVDLDPAYSGQGSMGILGSNL